MKRDSLKTLVEPLNDAATDWRSLNPLQYQRPVEHRAVSTLSIVAVRTDTNS